MRTVELVSLWPRILTDNTAANAALPTSTTNLRINHPKCFLYITDNKKI